MWRSGGSASGFRGAVRVPANLSLCVGTSVSYETIRMKRFPNLMHDLGDVLAPLRLALPAPIYGTAAAGAEAPNGMSAVSPLELASREGAK